jgi:hypothetical protein
MKRDRAGTAVAYENALDRLRSQPPEEQAAFFMLNREYQIGDPLG